MAVEVSRDNFFRIGAGLDDRLSTIENQAASSRTHLFPTPTLESEAMATAVSKPTITYFNLPGRAEVPRLLLEDAGVDYDFVTPSNWPELKSQLTASGTPTAVCPTLKMPVFTTRTRCREAPLRSGAPL